MHIEILKQFVDIDVEVVSSSRVLSGILKLYSSSSEYIVLTPTQKFIAKKFGPVIISRHSITSIRENKKVELEDDCCDSSEDIG